MNAIVLIFDGVEELEAIAPVDCLRRAGVEVVTVATGEDHQVRGRNEIMMTADCLLEEVAEATPDLLVLPGGPGHAALVNNPLVLYCLQKQADRDRLLGSICAGPVVLHAAGLLEGKRFTSFPGTADILPGRDAAQAVVRDGNLITSQGAGTAIEFALALVEALCGEAKRSEIAASICYGA